MFNCKLVHFHLFFQIPLSSSQVPFLPNKFSADDSLATLANTTHAKQVMPTQLNPPETTTLSRNVDPHQPRTI